MVRTTVIADYGSNNCLGFVLQYALVWFIIQQTTLLTRCMWWRRGLWRATVNVCGHVMSYVTCYCHMSSDVLLSMWAGSDCTKRSCSTCTRPVSYCPKGMTYDLIWSAGAHWVSEPSQNQLLCKLSCVCAQEVTSLKQAVELAQQQLAEAQKVL